MAVTYKDIYILESLYSTTYITTLRLVSSHLEYNQWVIGYCLVENNRPSDNRQRVALRRQR